MRGTSRSPVVLIGLILTILTGMSISTAQCYEAKWIPCGNGKCLVGVPAPCSTSGGSSGGSYSPSYRSPGPPREEKQAYSYNNRGVKAGKKGDWWAAYQDYKQAVALWPSEAIYKKNLAYAANELGRLAASKQDWDSAYLHFEEAATQWSSDPAYMKNLEIARWWLQVGYFKMADSFKIKQEEKAVAEQRAAEQRASATSVMRNSLSNAIDSLSSSKGSGSGKSSASPSGGLTFIDAGSTAAFGIASNPSDPGLRSLEARSPVTERSALEQLSSASKSGEDAGTAPRLDEARTHSTYQFDDQPRREPDAIPVPRSDATNRTAELLTHIRDANGVMQSNKIVKQMVDWYQGLDILREEAEAKRSEFQKQIDSGKGDAEAVAKKDALTSQIERLKKDQQTAVDTIKENLAAGWNEETPQAAGTGSKP